MTYEDFEPNSWLQETSFPEQVKASIKVFVLAKMHRFCAFKLCRGVPPWMTAMMFHGKESIKKTDLDDWTADVVEQAVVRAWENDLEERISCGGGEAEDRANNDYANLKLGSTINWPFVLWQIRYFLGTYERN